MSKQIDVVHKADRSDQQRGCFVRHILKAVSFSFHQMYSTDPTNP
jgi:hypothetical protein